jgi:hypothetical protein
MKPVRVLLERIRGHAPEPHQPVWYPVLWNEREAQKFLRMFRPKKLREEP